MQLHSNTPLIESTKLSKYANGRKVLLKLDNMQPGGSFKIRGIGHLVDHETRHNGKKSAVCSSGGNAGMAAAYACKKCNIPCTVFVPNTTTKQAIENIQETGAKVVIHGNEWLEADGEARKSLVDDTVLYISPFDHPLIWKGNGTLVDELKEANVTPSLIICAVGGGGLMMGILTGLERNQMSHVPVLAMETLGADSLNNTVKADKLVTLDSVKSIAKSLGASRVSSNCLPIMQNHPGGVTSKVCTDLEAIDAVEKFLEHHRFFVEPACGAALAGVYSGYLKGIDLSDGPIVVVVCGGIQVSVDLLSFWKEKAHS